MNESDVIKYLITLEAAWEKKRTRGLTSGKWADVLQAEAVIDAVRNIRATMVSMAERDVAHKLVDNT